MNDRKPTPAQKRRAYVLWFCIALAVDVAWSLSTSTPYRPSLVGLAIMITAVLFFAWSLLKKR